MRRASRVICCLSLIGLACGHSMTSQIGLMSFGDLEGKVVPKQVAGKALQGKDCSKIGGDPYSLAEAVRNAVKGTEYDTLVDVQVESTTGLFVGSNCVKVTGIALDSRTMEGSGGER
jgi:hypothetical protein